MKFSLFEALNLLERTPNVLQQFLKGLSSNWILTNEGNDTWSPYEVMEHLIQFEKKDWLQRIELILSDKAEKQFKPFDQVAQFDKSKVKLIDQLLQEFKAIRILNISRLKSMNISKQELEKTGVHPDFGEVTLAQLLSTWVVHDLNHISQITRVMARQYQSEVGPWTGYLKILKNQVSISKD